MPPTQSRKLSAFMPISLDGSYCDPHGAMSVAHNPPDDAAW
jgi:hypothetical protein